LLPCGTTLIFDFNSGLCLKISFLPNSVYVTKTSKKGNLRVTGKATMGKSSSDSNTLNVQGDAYISQKLHLGTQNSVSTIYGDTNKLDIKWLNATNSALNIDSNSNFNLSGTAILRNSPLTINNKTNSLKITNGINGNNKFSNQILVGNNGLYFQKSGAVFSDPKVIIRNNGSLSASNNINATTANISNNITGVALNVERIIPWNDGTNRWTPVPSATIDINTALNDIEDNYIRLYNQPS
jgi:hypothetical protein